MATVKEVYNALGKLIKKGKGDYTLLGQYYCDIHAPEDKDVIEERKVVEI